MVWPPGNPLASTLNDEFNANNLDTSKWYHRPGDEYPIRYNDNGRIRLNGMYSTYFYQPPLYLPPGVPGMSWHTGHLESQISNYNVDGVSAKIQPPNPIYNSEAWAYTDWSGSFYAIGNNGSPATSWGVEISLEQGSGLGTPFGMLRSYFNTSEGYSYREDPYDYEDHAYIRLRSLTIPNTESDKAWIPYKMTFIVDTSPNGTTWTTLLNSNQVKAPGAEDGFKIFFYNFNGYMWLDHFKGWPATNLKVRLSSNTWKDVPIPQVRTKTNSWTTPPGLKVRLANNTWKDL